MINIIIVIIILFNNHTIIDNDIIMHIVNVLITLSSSAIFFSTPISAIEMGTN